MSHFQFEDFCKLSLVQYFSDSRIAAKLYFTLWHETKLFKKAHCVQVRKNVSAEV
jgi:hypothetical protein